MTPPAMKYLMPLALMLIAACTDVASIESAVAADASRVDRRLIGEWMVLVEHDSARVVIVPGADSLRYSVLFVDSDSALVTRTEGRLGRVGRFQVLDIGPADRAPAALMFRLHRQAVIDSIGRDVFVVRWLSGEEVWRFLRARSGSSWGFKAGDNLVLAGDTPALVKLLSELYEHPELMTPQVRIERR